MNLEISNLADVPSALDLVKEEVAKAEEAIRAEGAKAMISGPLKAAEEAIAYAKRLRAFISEIEALGLKWEKLADKAENASPEAREIVRRAGVDDRKAPDPKTNFEVLFPNGEVVHERMANLTLGKTLEKIGPDRVASLKGSTLFAPNGEPLLTRYKSDLAKYPAQILEIKDGWFVNTQTDTERKAETVREISRRLKLHLKVTIVPGTYVNTGAKNTSTSLPSTTSSAVTNNHSSFPYAVGKVVQAVFPVLQTDSRMTPEAVKMLIGQSSSSQFKTGGNPVLKPRTGGDNETRDQYGYHRYYGKLPLRFFGKDYWLTSQFNPPGIGPVLDWLHGLGFTREEVLRICEKRWGKNNAKQGELPL